MRGEAWAALQIVVFVGGALAPLQAAHATLGSDLASIEQNQIQFDSTLSAEKKVGFTVYTHILPSATVVREYISDQGKVFGVAWQGPFWPDFKPLLGDYYSAYVTFVKQRRLGVAAAQSNNLVIESNGKMGAFSGRMYLPNELPDGVLADLIQ